MDLAIQFRREGIMPLIGIGVIAGIFAALFGIGGGIVIVPLLILVTHMPPRAAAATSLATLILTSMIGVARYAGSGHINWLAAVLIGAPAVAGVLLGIRIQKRVPIEWLVIAFGAFVILIGLRMISGI